MNYYINTETYKINQNYKIYDNKSLQNYLINNSNENINNNKFFNDNFNNYMKDTIKNGLTDKLLFEIGQNYFGHKTSIELKVKDLESILINSFKDYTSNFLIGQFTLKNNIILKGIRTSASINNCFVDDGEFLINNDIYSWKNIGTSLNRCFKINMGDMFEYDNKTHYLNVIYKSSFSYDKTKIFDLTEHNKPTYLQKLIYNIEYYQRDTYNYIISKLRPFDSIIDSGEKLLLEPLTNYIDNQIDTYITLLFNKNNELFEDLNIIEKSLEDNIKINNETINDREIIDLIDNYLKDIFFIESYDIMNNKLINYDNINYDKIIENNKLNVDYNDIQNVANKLNNINKCLNLIYLSNKGFNIFFKNVCSTISFELANSKIVSDNLENIGIFGFNCLGKYLQNNKLKVEDAVMFIIQENIAFNINGIKNLIISLIKHKSIKDNIKQIGLDYLLYLKPELFILFVFENTLKIINKIGTHMGNGIIHNLPVIWKQKIDIFNNVDTYLDCDILDIHIHVSTSKCNKGRNKATEEFNKQFNIKCYPILGIPPEFIDNETDDNKSYYEKYIKSKYLSILHKNWEEKHKFTEEEKEDIKNSQKSKEEIRDEITEKNKYTENSYWNIHKNENIFYFIINLYNEFIKKKSIIFIIRIVKPLYNTKYDSNENIDKQVNTEYDNNQKKQIHIISSHKKDLNDNKMEEMNKNMNNEKVLYENHEGKYSRYNVVKEVNYNLLIDDFSAVLIIGSIGSSFYSLLVSSVIYIDYDYKIYKKKNSNYLKKKLKIMRDIYYQRISTILLTKHSAITLALCFDTISEEVLNKFITPNIMILNSMIIGASYSLFNKKYKKKSLNNDFKIMTFNALQVNIVSVSDYISSTIKSSLSNLKFDLIISTIKSIIPLTVLSVIPILNKWFLPFVIMGTSRLLLGNLNKEKINNKKLKKNNKKNIFIPSNNIVIFSNKKIKEKNNIVIFSNKKIKEKNNIIIFSNKKI